MTLSTYVIKLYRMASSEYLCDHYYMRLIVFCLSANHFARLHAAGAANGKL
jgi:hypothetical protein